MKNILLALLIVAASFSGFVAHAQSGSDEDFNLCTAFTKENIRLLIKNSSDNLLLQYGKSCTDSIQAVAKKTEKLYSSGQLLEQAVTVPFKADTTSFVNRLHKIMATATTTEDSIEALSQWLAATFINAEHNPSMHDMNARIIYIKVMQGKLSGDANNAGDFFCKIAQSFPHWGAPLLVNSVAVPNDADTMPLEHSWVGFAHADGKIWCVADPFLGGLVRQKNNGTVLSYDTITAWLKHPVRWQQVNVTPVAYSLRSSTACVMSLLLNKTDGLTYAEPDGQESGFVRAAWISPADVRHYTHSLNYALWKKNKFPGNTFYNFYLLPETARLYSDNTQLSALLKKRYGLNIEAQP